MKPHIFWVLTDSLRPYYTKDRFSKIPIYDELRKEGVLFENVVASAPSTAMSISSILTGQWSIYLSHTFDALRKIDARNYINILKKTYKIFSSICFPEGVALFGTLLNAYERKNPHKFFPGSSQLTTKQSYEHFLQIMKQEFDPSQPNFVFVHFRAGDHEHDTYLRKIVTYLKKKKFFEDSIFIASSDHGYFDPTRHKKREFLHYDAITEESLKAIQYIHFPPSLSSVRNRSVQEQVSTIDLFETLCDYLSIQHNLKEITAISFKPLLEQNTPAIRDKFNNRIIRSDTRFLLQVVSKTSIKNAFYKLVFDRQNFQFFDLRKDPFEKKNLFHNASYEPIISRFKKVLSLTNKKAERKVLQSLKKSYSKSLLKDFKGEKIFLYDFIHPLLLSFLYKELSPNNKVLIISEKGLKMLQDRRAKVFFFPMNYYQMGFQKVMRWCAQKQIKFYCFNHVFEEIPSERFFPLFWRQIKINKKKFFQRPFYLMAFLYRVLHDYKTIRVVSRIYKEQNQKFTSTN